MAFSPQQEAEIIQSCRAAHAEIRGLKGALGALQQAKSAASALTPLVPRFIEDIPGKRVPYTYGVNLQPAAGAAWTTALVSGVLTISSDGPFLATGLVAAWRPTTGTSVVGAIAMTGRWRPISSTNAITQDGVGSLIAMPDAVDFVWNYSEAGSDRARQNIDRSSVELFSNQDRPCYLPIADFFERNTAVTVNVTMLRNPTNTGVLYFGFCGYKLLQPIAFAG